MLECVLLAQAIPAANQIASVVAEASVAEADEGTGDFVGNYSLTRAVGEEGVTEGVMLPLLGAFPPFGWDFQT